MDRILTKQELMKYYSNKDLQNILWEFGRSREVVARAIDGGYFKRPSTLAYPADVLGLVMKGAASFHASVERWSNPLLIDDRNQGELRTGFDWIVDIDSSLGLEEAKIASLLVRDFLEKYRLEYFIKFSGRRGFHFCIFWENFPEAFDYKESRALYPELPKILSTFLRERIKDKLWQNLVQYKGSVKELTGQENPKIRDPFRLVEVEKDWSNRHLFRMPYSIHEKTGKASVLIEPEKLEKFQPEMAEIGNFELREIHVRGNQKGGELLISDAIYWSKKIDGIWGSSGSEDSAKGRRRKDFVYYKGKVMRDNFPPCMEAVLSGIKDGRKRSTFTLISFLRSCNWPWTEVEEKALDWGKKVGLREGFVKAQLAWHKKQPRNILPPNCQSGLFYKDIAICKPLPLCAKIRNPVNFAFIKAGKTSEDGKKVKKRKKKTRHSEDS